MANNSKTTEANAQFKKTQREIDGKKAMSEYESGEVALRARTAKLRALRLARDAELAAAAPPAPEPAKKKKAVKKAASKSAPLSDFLKARQDSGRTS